METRLLSTQGTDRTRRLAFMLPPAVWAAFGALAPLPVLNRLGLGDEVMPLIALAGMAGGSFGLLQADWRVPDGFDGWGRVAALWLGFTLLLPGAAALGLRPDPPQMGYMLLSTVWVIGSALFFGRWETLNAAQCWGFSLRFYGGWLVVMLVAAALPPASGGWVLTAAFLGYPAFAGYIRKGLSTRSTLFLADWSTPYPPAHRRWFFALLVPWLALASYDFASTFGGKTPPHFGGVLETVGVPGFPGIGILGLCLVHLLPPYTLLVWMRGGLSLRSMRDSGDLLRYAAGMYILTTGHAWMAFALIHVLSKKFFTHWMTNFPVTALTVLAILTIAFGLFWFRLMLSMDVMRTPFLRKDGRHGA